jgi:regulator of sigma E protease
LKIIIALLIFSLIIIIHEFGHFSFAKLNGICVEEFSLGLGPTLFGVQKGETKYSLKLLPFGAAA